MSLSTAYSPADRDRHYAGTEQPASCPVCLAGMPSSHGAGPRYAARLGSDWWQQPVEVVLEVAAPVLEDGSVLCHAALEPGASCERCGWQQPYTYPRTDQEVYASRSRGAAISAGMRRANHAGRQWELARRGLPHEPVPTLEFLSRSLITPRTELHACEVCHRENLQVHLEP